MHKNKFQKKRALRSSASAASATQTELLQGPIQQPSGSQLSIDLGRETARQLRENANPNTRFIDKPTPTTDRNLLRQAAGRQQSMIRDAQQQAFSKHNVPQVNPGGRYVAPSVPISNLVFRGGGVRFQPTMRGNLLTAVAGVAAELLVEPVADVISDYVINPMIGAVFGKDIPPAKELRRIQIMKKEIEFKDAKNERLYQQKSEEAQLPITEEEAPRPPAPPEPASYAPRAVLKPYPHRSIMKPS